MKIDLVLKERPELVKPIIICGLPGSAFVGKFAVDHLIRELPAKLLAEIYCNGFPSQVVIREDGTASMLKNEIFYWRNEAKGRDVIFYTGDTQPGTTESEYELSDFVIDFLINEYKAKELVTLGAFVTGEEARTPRVFSAATDESLAKEIEALGCTAMNEGTITGMNGLLLGVARVRGLSGYTLLGETSGYSFDARASEVILSMLSRLLGFKLDYTKLEQRAKEAQDVVKAIEKARRQQQGLPPEEEAGEASDKKKRLDYIS